MMGFSRLFWIWNITGEVFSLNNALCAGLIYGSLVYMDETCSDRKLRVAHWLSFLSGVCMSNQHTSILFIIPCALFVANTTFDEGLLTRRSFCTILLSATAGLLPYLQLPLASYLRMAKVTWGDHRTLEGFLFHFFRKDFGTFKLVQTEDPGSMINNAKVMLADVTRELTLPLLILAVMGIFSILWRKERRGYILYLIALHVSYTSFFCSLANIDAVIGIYRGVLERFWMQPSIVTCLLAAEGLHELIKAARINKFYLFPVAIVLVAARVHSNYGQCDMSDNHHAENFGRHVLQHLPANSIMLTSGDLSTNTFRYLTIAEKVRPDVLVLDMSFMGSAWFLPMIAEHMEDIIIPGIGYKPGPSHDARFYNVERFLKYNLHRRPVFSCLKPKKEAHGWEKRYMLLPFSYCSQFVKRGAVNHLIYGTNLPSPSIAEYLPPRTEMFGEHTWENVLLHEYWEAKVKAGRYLWDQGEKARDPGAKKLLYSAAYEYLSKQKEEISAGIESGKLSPVSWNHTSYFSKYLGVQCRQLWFLHDQDPKYDACQRKHFRDYVDSVPILARRNDKDFPGVVKLLETPGL